MSAARIVADLRALEELGVATTATFARRVGTAEHNAGPRLRALHAAGLADRGRIARTFVYLPRA